MDELHLGASDPTAGLSDSDLVRLKSELRPGERVLWASGSLHDPRRSDAGCLVPFLIAAGLSWLTTLVGLANAVRPGPGEGAWGVVALVVGLFLAIPLSIGLVASISAAWGLRGKRWRRLYALTDARAIFWEPGDGRSVVVSHLQHRQIQRVWRVEHPDGAGDVVLRATVPGPQHDRQQTFFGVPDARRAEDLARTLGEQARPRRRRANRSPLPDDDPGAPAPSQDPRP